MNHTLNTILIVSKIREYIIVHERTIMQGTNIAILVTCKRSNNKFLKLFNIAYVQIVHIFE